MQHEFKGLIFNLNNAKNPDGYITYLDKQDPGFPKKIGMVISLSPQCEKHMDRDFVTVQRLLPQYGPDVYNDYVGLAMSLQETKFFEDKVIIGLSTYTRPEKIIVGVLLTIQYGARNFKEYRVMVEHEMPSCRTNPGSPNYVPFSKNKHLYPDVPPQKQHQQKGKHPHQKSSNKPHHQHQKQKHQNNHTPNTQMADALSAALKKEEHPQPDVDDNIGNRGEQQYVDLDPNGCEPVVENQPVAANVEVYDAAE